MKSPLIFFSTFFFGLHSFAQSSFSVDVDFPATPPEETAVLNLNYLEQDEQQNLWLIGRPFFSYDAFLMEEDPMVFLHLDNQGVPATGHAVGIEGISLFRSFGYDYEKGYHAYIYRSPSGPPDIPKNYLVVANFQDGIFWSRRTTNIGYFFGPLGIKGDRVFYYQNTTSSGVGPHTTGHFYKWDD